MAVRRTWPYGTRKTCKVLLVDATSGTRWITMQDCDNEKEGYVCSYNRTEHKKVEVEDTVIIEFKPGGPTGGYWDIVEIVK